MYFNTSFQLDNLYFEHKDKLSCVDTAAVNVRKEMTRKTSSFVLSHVLMLQDLVNQPKVILREQERLKLSSVV